jgi:hypothetical protein
MAAHAGPHRPENRQVSLGKTSSPGRDGATSRGTLDRAGIASLIDVHQPFEAMSEMGRRQRTRRGYSWVDISVDPIDGKRSLVVRRWVRQYGLPHLSPGVV